MTLFFGAMMLYSYFFSGLVVHSVCIRLWTRDCGETELWLQPLEGVDFCSVKQSSYHGMILVLSE